MVVRKRIILIVLVIWLCLSLSLSFGFGADVSSLPYGINVHHAGNDVLKKAVDAGIKWIRTEAHWFAVEIQEGVFDWSQIDRLVSYAQGNGLSVLLMIGYTPGWANRNQGINYPADQVGDWENFVRITVNRYKSRVKYWNIWNEPNSADFFVPGKDVFVEKVFLPAAKVIRSEDPSAFIVGPELAHLVSLNEEWYFWMKYILTEGSGYIDIVSHHIYKNEGVFYIYQMLEEGEDFIPSVQRIIEESGYGSMPFWITETGWNTRAFSESAQAERYLEMLQERREKSCPDKIFFYEIIDDPTPGIDPWGILRSDLTEKPAYTVYKDFIAGKYPNDGNGNGDDDDTKKKCLAEKIAGRDAGGRSGILSNLRDFRDGLKNLSPAARELVRLYYDMNEEFLELALRDSRIYRLGVELIHEADRLITRHKGDILNQRLEKSMVLKVERLFSFLKEKQLSASFNGAVMWGKRQLRFLKTGTLGNYLLVHLPGEVRTFMETGKKEPPPCKFSTER